MRPRRTARARAAVAALLVAALPGVAGAASEPQGETRRESVTSDGLQASDQSDRPDITADGRFVAFESAAPNLVAADTNGARDVFVRDRDPDQNGVFELGSGATERLSLGAAAAQANGASRAPSISGAGRWVAFESDATNLVVADTNATTDVFVRDRQSGVTVRVSVSTSGAQATGASRAASISADGRFVAFESDASNLVSGDTNGATDVFLRDRDTDADGIFDEPGAVSTRRMSLDTAGAQAADGGASPAIAPGGRHVAFHTAGALDAADTNGALDVYVRDRVANTTTLVSLATGGAQGDAASRLPDLTADGRYVAFTTAATTLDPAGAGVLVRDRDIDADGILDEPGAVRTIRASVSTYGAIAPETFALPTMSVRPAISPEGRSVAFVADVSGITEPPKANHCGYFGPRECTDVFVRDLWSDTLTRVSLGSLGEEGNGDSFAPAIAAQGAYVAFSSRASNFAPGDDNACIEDPPHTQPCRDVFVRHVDRIAPAAPVIVAPASGSEIHVSTVTVSGTHPEPGNRVRVFNDGVVAAQVIVNVAGGWEATIPVADGTRALTARAVDPSGNFSALSAPSTLLVDTIPDIVATAPYQSRSIGGGVCRDILGMGEGTSAYDATPATGAVSVSASAVETAPYGHFLPDCRGLGGVFASGEGRIVHEIPVAGPGTFEVRARFAVSGATASASGGSNFLDGALGQTFVNGLFTYLRCNPGCAPGGGAGEFAIRTGTVVNSDDGPAGPTIVVSAVLTAGASGPGRIRVETGFRAEASAWGRNSGQTAASGTLTSIDVFVDP